ncbi:hypothetical protein H5410_022503 [Solanum commersonii]|uniref:Uncharacterized protein n=1 Tax=Solanum commersonii TaxID=4109 RepID=A0A9J5ZJD6_SOLCO|nr:hypothetical protein H5410_022503 [Solanum commersonii]
MKEVLFETSPTIENRKILQKAQAELKRYVHFEKEYWRQKAVRGRRKRLSINRIHNMEGEWVEGEELMVVAAQEYFQKQFTGIHTMEEVPLVRYIQKRVTEEDNKKLNNYPSMEEVNKVVFSLNGDSAGGPDGVTLPKSITHTNLVLLPKRDICQSFSDMRPISLNDTIIFTSADGNSLDVLMATLRYYEKQSG